MQNRRQENIHSFFMQLLTGILLLLTVFIYAINADMNDTRDRLYATVDYVKEQCNRFSRIEMAAETKSLMRVMESNKQVTYQIMENEGEYRKDSLRSYARNSYVSGVVILNSEGVKLSEYHDEGKEPEVFSEVLTSPALLDLFQYPEKRYAVRMDSSDGSEIDIAAMRMMDQDKIVVVYYHTPLEYIESFNLSIAALLSSYKPDRDGVIAVSQGGEIIACNDDTLVGQSTEGIPILCKITESRDGNRLVHTNQQGNSVSQYFGLMGRGRDCYVYGYVTEREVFSSTPRMIIYTLVIYMVLIVIIYAVKKKNEQQYQLKYTKELQSKNDQLGEAIKEANQANEAKTNFLSRMSHDIRTPLNGIIGLLEISETHPDDKEMLKDNRKKMRIAANHLLSLINDVLQMSKLESGEIIIAHEPMDLKQLSSDVIAIVEQKAAEEGVTLTFDKNSDMIEHNWVYGSALHIRQIFLNIYTNSIKYNKVGGTIHTNIKLVKIENQVVTYQWTITDTGIGMSKEFVERLFDPFTQERSDARSVYQGTGLGMTIVKGLLEQMQGSIVVHSEEGVGTEFVITLPFEIAEKPEKVKALEQKTFSLDGLNILMAEDNELNAEIAQILLEDNGVKVTVVGDGKQAVEVFDSNVPGSFDVILMDIMMPVMDGLTATRNIRALNRPDAKKIPIIAMTANAFQEDAEKCLAAGMNAHLAKPLDFDRLKQIICQQIQSKPSRIGEN